MAASPQIVNPEYSSIPNLQSQSINPALINQRIINP
jgi:hypothetical protein